MKVLLVLAKSFGFGEARDQIRCLYKKWVSQQSQVSSTHKCLFCTSSHKHTNVYLKLNLKQDLAKVPNTDKKTNKM